MKCSEKQKYKTKDAAAYGAMKLFETFGYARIYHCDKCKCWHLTKKPYKEKGV